MRIACGPSCRHRTACRNALDGFRQTLFTCIFSSGPSEVRDPHRTAQWAKAIVFKDQPISTLISCVRDALAEEECMAPDTVIPQPPAVSASQSVNGLSPRERQVAQWVAVGARNKEIAWQLGISEGTVKLHLFHAYQKLGVGNRVGLVLALRKTASDILAGITFVSLTFV